MVSVGQVWGLTGYKKDPEEIIVVRKIIGDRVYYSRLNNLDELVDDSIHKADMNNTYPAIRLISG